MPSARVLRIAASALGSMCVAYLAWEWSQSQLTLSTPPPRGAAAAVVTAPRESVVGLRASISYEELRVAAEAATLEPVWGNDASEHCERPLGVRVCLGWRAEWNVRRDGPVSVGKSGDAVRASLPIRFDGNAGFRGDLATILGLDQKNFDGALTARLDFRFDLDQQWCPVVSASIDFDWRLNPRVEIIDGVYIDVRGQVEGPLRNEVRKLEREIRNALPCDSFQAELRRHWRGYSLPLPAGGGIPVLHVVASPTTMAFSGMVPQDDRVGVAIVLRARTEVAAQPGPTASLPLPPLNRTLYELGRVRLAVPVRAPYDTLGAAVSAALVGREFLSESPAGRVVIRPSTVELYPSGTRLVAAVAFTADLPGRLLDAKGTAYLFGTPVLVGGRTVQLTNVGFARDLDHPAWSVLSVVLQERIVVELESAARYDLGPLVEDASRRVREASRAAGAPGMQIELAPPSFALEVVAVSDEGLLAAVGAETSAEVTVTRAVFRPQ
jgi:hypothetical protein